MKPGRDRVTSSVPARARTLCADWRDARARRRRRERTASSSLDSACSSFSTSSRPPKMPFHTRDTRPRCFRFCVNGVSGGAGDCGDAVATAVETGASPSAISGANGSRDQRPVGSDPRGSSAGKRLKQRCRGFRALLDSPKRWRICFVEARFWLVGKGLGKGEREVAQTRSERLAKDMRPEVGAYVSLFFNRIALRNQQIIKGVHYRLGLYLQSWQTRSKPAVDNHFPE